MIHQHGSFNLPGLYRRFERVRPPSASWGSRASLSRQRLYGLGRERDGTTVIFGATLARRNGGPSRCRQPGAGKLTPRRSFFLLFGESFAVSEPFQHSGHNQGEPHRRVHEHLTKTSAFSRGNELAPGNRFTVRTAR